MSKEKKRAMQVEKGDDDDVSQAMQKEVSYI